MKRLILVRHGKSSWKQELPDEQRPLKKRGYRDAELITTAFLGTGLELPELLWSSPAKRALTTAKLLREKLELESVHFSIRDSLYTFSPAALKDCISKCPDAVDVLMVVGHNPAITDITNSLGDRNFKNIPTTGLVLINFETSSWNNLENGKTGLFLFPKNLR